MINDEISCFNGAVPFQARKLDMCILAKEIKYKLQWGRAFSGTEINTLISWLSPMARFNGAVPFQARKLYTMDMHP